MIIAYAFVAFLFFKIFPEFAGYRSNTVVGALIMATVSALILQAATWAAAWRIGVWVQSPPSRERDAPSGLVLVALGAIAASVGSTFLVGVGFSDDLMRSAFIRFRADPSLFWAMAAIPPILHIALVFPKYRKAVVTYQAIRKDPDLNF